jgi:hypothetical protein
VAYYILDIAGYMEPIFFELIKQAEGETVPYLKTSQATMKKTYRSINTLFIPGLW